MKCAMRIGKKLSSKMSEIRKGQKKRKYDTITKTTTQQFMVNCARSQFQSYLLSVLCTLVGTGQ